jgi:hypothetical protein
VLIFDVNDLSDVDIDALVGTYVRAYVDRVRWFVDRTDDRAYSLRMDTTEGPIHQML